MGLFQHPPISCSSLDRSCTSRAPVLHCVLSTWVFRGVVSPDFCGSTFQCTYVCGLLSMFIQFASAQTTLYVKRCDAYSKPRSILICSGRSEPGHKTNCDPKYCTSGPVQVYPRIRASGPVYNLDPYEFLYVKLVWRACRRAWFTGVRAEPSKYMFLDRKFGYA